MGEIGKSLPKVLWPIFEKTLLELQVEYAKSIGAKKIYINLHHQKDLILNFTKNKSAFEDVTFLVEDEILDIGGGIHNLASNVGYKGKLLVLNADQFFLMPKDFVEASLKKLSRSPVLLFSYQVDPRLGYNCLELTSENTLKAIVPAAELKNTSSGVTYTGISLIDLSKLTPHPGKSSFFESVARFTETDVLVEGVGNIDYWDFGTAQRYWLTMRRVISTYKVNSVHPFLRFLVNSKALKSWKINHNHLSYHSSGLEVIHLGLNQDNSNSQKVISLTDHSFKNVVGPAIIFDKIEEKISL